MRHIPHALLLLLATLVAACGAAGVAPDPAGSGTVVRQATMAPAATSIATPVATRGGAAPVGSDPGCNQVLTLDELAGISTVDGWALTRSDDAMPDTDVTCQWDFKPDTAEWLHAEVHVWSDGQAERFLAGGLPGEAAGGLGDAAAWDPIGGRLLVQLGGRVLGVVPGAWLGPEGVRAGAVAIAELAIPRLPR
jgi:hypothetical protein